MTAVNGNGVQSPQTAQAATKAIGLPTPGEFGIDVEPYDKGESDLVDKVMLLSDKAKLELLSDIDVRAPAPAGGTRRVSQTRTGLLWCRRACRRSRREAPAADATARSAEKNALPGSPAALLHIQGQVRDARAHTRGPAGARLRPPPRVQVTVPEASSARLVWGSGMPPR